MFYLYCSKKGFTDENKEKFAKFLELNSNVKVTPLIYKEFLDDLEDNGLLDEYLSEGDES